MSEAGGNSSFWKLENESSLSSAEGSKEEEAVGGSTSLRLVAKSQTSTRVSLLIEALIGSMVATYEKDSRKATQAYRRICKRLFHMGLIDGSWSMTELEGARVQFEHGVLQLLGVGPGSSPSFPSLSPGGDITSQYKREFDEIKQIGVGAFGKVFQVKHKLDGTKYAMKKIPIYAEGLDSLNHYLSEVKTIASISHPNIVPYKAAWLEIGSPENFRSLPNLDQNKPKITISAEEPEHIIFNKNTSFVSNNSDSDFEIAFEDSRDCICRSNNSSSEDANTSDAAKAVVLQENVPLRQHVSWAILYIQMSLCHGTLHQWLRKRTKSFNPEVAVTSNATQTFKTKAIKEILIQILRGLAYIHSKGIVHHDIKPSNIFISADGGSLLVQLGDFGLACPLQRARHSLAKGTPLYAAPEQLAGRCDPKSDMYSVGIVLFELLEDFSTEMERTKRISELRGRTIQPISHNLELNDLVTALVRRRPEERPDALTLLHSLEATLDASSSEIEDLQARLSEKDREIERLTELLRKHGVQDV